MSESQILFHSELSLEDSLIKKGYAEGIGIGLKQGYDEGKDLGYSKGYEIGSEVGFYYGLYVIWNEFFMKFPDLIPPRGKKAIEVLGDKINKFPLDNIKEQNILEELESIRAKFKLCLAVLKQNCHYNQREKAYANQMSF